MVVYIHGIYKIKVTKHNVWVKHNIWKCTLKINSVGTYGIKYAGGAKCKLKKNTNIYLYTMEW